MHRLPFFSFFLLKHKCTDVHNFSLSLSLHTQRHTYTGTTFMPCDLARHYANGQTCHLPEISEIEWERERERVSERKWERERFCTFASLWELLVKCKYSTYAGKVKCSCYSYLQCTVVWGLSILRRKKRKETRETRDLWDLMWNCSEEHAMFTVHCLNSWKASWKARSEPKQPKSVTFQGS